MMNFKIVFIALFSAFSMSACGNAEENAEVSTNDKQANIELMEQQLFSNANKMINDSIAALLIDAYDEFASLYPKDSLSPDYLFKAGEVSMGLGKPLKSMSFFTKVYDRYPDFEKAPYSLFLQAYVLDNHLNDDVRAGEIYTDFINKYPDHPMAKDADFSIKNLGKSDEELIKEFEKKNNLNL
jgi:TolA-binding protein